MLSRPPSRLPLWQTWWVIVPALLLCFPLGLVGVWLRPGLTTNLRWVLTGATAAFLVLVLALPDEPSPTGRDEAPAASAPEVDAVVDQKPTGTPTAAVPVAVPDLVGQDREEARAALEGVGLVLGEIATEPSRRAADSVLRQSTAAGTEAAPGSSVDVVLAAPLPEVPDVLGLREGKAVKRLERAGFVVDVSTRVTRTGADGVVLEQRPGAATGKRPGATIRIVVSDVQIAPLAQSPPADRNCTPGYSPCLAPASDYDCAGGSGDGPEYVYGTVRVTGSDPYDLDRDGNGIGCD
ncbi:hypothetical protein GCM10009788_45860 [Nocardioides humi]|uniref:PASTA domain-containing protein n=2 Tax=Nocardioides humi TaxID=449461 RepID=A0ABN2BC24_9ACTN